MGEESKKALLEEAEEFLKKYEGEKLKLENEKKNTEDNAALYGNAYKGYMNNIKLRLENLKAQRQDAYFKQKFTGQEFNFLFNDISLGQSFNNISIYQYDESALVAQDL